MYNKNKTRCIELESLKVPSRIVTVIVTVVIALLTYVATMTPEALAGYLPQEFAGYAALIIVIAAAIVNQYSEEKRVERAEELAIQKSTTVLGAPLDGGIVLNDEYIAPDDSETEDVSDDGC